MRKRDRYEETMTDISSYRPPPQRIVYVCVSGCWASCRKSTEWEYLVANDFCRVSSLPVGNGIWSR